MDWNSSALWGIIGLIGGFFSSFIFHKISTKTKKIIYTKNSQTLVTNSLSEINGLNITFHNQPIKNLTSTTLTIRSVGKDIINLDDFGKATPLCIKTTECFFLQENVNSIICKNSNPNNLMKLIIKDEKTILLDFDYLSQEDEVEFVLLHTGTIEIDGKLKSGTLLNKNNSKKFDLFTINNLAFTLIYIAMFAQIMLYEYYDIALSNISYFTFFLGVSYLIISKINNFKKHSNEKI